MTCISTQRMISGHSVDAVSGDVYWTPHRSIWTMAMTLIAVIAGPLLFT